MHTVLNEGDRLALARRLASLTESSARRWGRMGVAGMLAHLCQSSRMALGELPVRGLGKRAFHTFPLKHLVLYVLPFPKGVRTAPELLVAETDDLAVGRASLRDLLERVGTGPADGAGPEHPFLGPLSRREWGVLLHKHLDHHLRQFSA